MDEIIALIAAVPGTVPLAAIITFGLFAIFRGWLTPSHIVADRIKDKDDEILRLREDRDERYDDLIEERNDWRDAYRTASASVVELEKQNGELIEVGRISRHVLESLPQPVPGKAHVVMPMEAGEVDGNTSEA